MSASGWDPRLVLDTPLGYQLLELARGLLGSGEDAAAAVNQALSQPPQSRIDALTRTVAACRQDGRPSAERCQREALALRELVRLSYAQIASVIGDGVQDVGLLLARARLDFCDQHAPAPADPPCAERQRALAVLARRLDSEPVSHAEGVWIVQHTAGCRPCARAEVLMLDASVRYRVWARR